MQNVIKKVVWGALIIIPFIALYVASGRGLDIFSLGEAGMYFPYISGKNFAFRILVEIAFAGWILLALRDASYRINLKKSPLLLAYALFVTILFFADIFGVDVAKSMWSNYERMEGFVGHIHLFLYFVVLSGMLATVSDWSKMFKAFLISNILVTVYAFSQLFGASGYFVANHFPKVAEWFAMRFPISQSVSRLDATLGNSAYYAIYCMMFIFIFALLWIQSKNFKKAWWYPVLIALNIAGLFYSGTRGTMIGVLVGGVATLVIIAYFEKGNVRRYVAAAVVAILLAVGSIFVFKNSSFVQSSPTLLRLSSISPNDITGASRLSMWKISYQAWKERPVLGYGQDNFSYVFARKFIPEKMSSLEPWYDRSHDVFFDWLIAAGLLGLLSYLSLYGVSLWIMWGKKNDMPVRERAIITGMLIGYFIHNVFVFDNLVSYILFVLFLAYIDVRASIKADHHQQRGVHISDENMKLLWAPLVIIILAVTQYYINYRPMLVNKLLIQALDANRLIQVMPFEKVLEVQRQTFQTALQMNTLGSGEAREQFSQTALRMAQVTIPPEVPAEQKKVLVENLNALLSAVKDDITSNYNYYKDDVRMLSIFGMFYNGVGDGASAEKILTQAHTLAPKKQMITNDLIRAYLLQQKTAQAYALAKENFELAPNYKDALKWYKITALYANSYKEASENIKAKSGALTFDEDVLNTAVGLGQIQVAIGMLNDLKKERPEVAAQADAFIKQLQNAPKVPVATPKK
jgi:O-antigen ligase